MAPQLTTINRELTHHRINVSQGYCLPELFAPSRKVWVFSLLCLKTSIYLFIYLKIGNGEVLVSYDVSTLFTNVTLEETIEILADKASTNNWFTIQRTN